MDEKRARFERQVLPHLDAAYRFACWLARSPGDAEDVVQEAMLRAYRGFEGLKGADVKAWLLAIVRNCHATGFTRQQRHAHEPLPEEHDARDGHAMIAATPDPETDAIRRDDRRLLAQLIAALPEEHREVLILREVEDMDYREIAMATGVPIGTVMSRLSRARAGLKALWPKDAEGDARGVR